MAADLPLIRLPETLTDGVLVLDAHRIEDAEAHLAGEDDEMRRRFDSLRPATLEETRGAMARWMAQRAAGGPQFAYAARLDGVLIGGCELRMLTPAAANISYWLAWNHRGRGHATRAVALLCDAAAAIDGLEAIEAHVAPDNLASRRLAERSGFVESGTVEEAAWHGAISTMVRYVRRLARR
jgi:RimJ/RimL family protein N-acetyltransferase